MTKADIMILVRKVFGGPAGTAGIQREDAVRAVARELGYQRPREGIRAIVGNGLVTAARRRIVYSRQGVLYRDTRTIDYYSRDELKQYFLAAIGRSLHEDGEAIRKAARHIGFSRAKGKIQRAFGSVIRGLLRQGRIERVEGMVGRV